MEYDQLQLNRQVLSIPLAASLSPRSWSIGKDGVLQNCYLETSSNGKKYVTKRPGYSLSATYGGAAAGQGLTYFGDRLYAVAGNTLYRVGAVQLSYSNGGTWTSPGSAQWAARSSYASAVFKGKVYITGGLTGLGVYANDTWSSQDAVNWAQVAPQAPWGGRIRPQLTTFAEGLYLTGGLDAAGVYNKDVWFSENGTDWEQLTQSAPWAGRYGHGAVAFNNNLVIMGGSTAAGVYSNEIWGTADGVEWKQLTAPGWAARGNFGLLVLNGTLYLIGGADAATRYNDVWSTTDLVTWTQLTAAAFGSSRQAFGATVYDSKLWVVGGNTAVGDTADVYYSSNGAVWTLVTAAPGFTGRAFLRAESFPTPSSHSTINALSMFIFGGVATGVVQNAIYHGSINALGSTSFGLTTTAPTIEPVQFTKFSSNQYLVIKNSYDAWVLWGNTINRITDKDYPTRTVPGLVYLNRRMYVMDPDGIIYGTEIDNPTSLSALNFIEAEYEPDKGVALAKYINYLVALGENNVQFFYDAGTFPGSPLEPQMNMTSRVGCVSAYTVVNTVDTILWVGRTDDPGRGVYMMKGNKPSKVSSTEVDRILDQESFSQAPFAFAFKANGHSFYCLNLVSLNYTLTYDLTEDKWSVWTSSGSKLSFSGYATDGRSNFVQEAGGTNVYQLSTIVNGDNNVPIQCTGTLDLVDFDTTLCKFQRNLTVVGDRGTSSPNNITISWTDDDYNTFNSGYIIDLFQQKPWTHRGGRFYRRGYRFSHFSATQPMRLERLDVQVDFGNV